VPKRLVQAYQDIVTLRRVRHHGGIHEREYRHAWATVLRSQTDSVASRHPDWIIRGNKHYGGFLHLVVCDRNGRFVTDQGLAAIQEYREAWSDIRHLARHLDSPQDVADVLEQMPSPLGRENLTRAECYLAFATLETNTSVMDPPKSIIDNRADLGSYVAGVLARAAMARKTGTWYGTERQKYDTVVFSEHDSWDDE